MSVIVFVLTLDEIDGVSKIMPQINKEWATKIIFVDGGSTDGTIEKAKELIWLAAEAGADAAKFQHFKAKTIVSEEIVETATISF